MKSQNLRLHAYMKRKSITAQEALSELGIARLAARIRDLRDRGVGIHKIMVEGHNRYGEKVRFARYFLMR